MKTGYKDIHGFDIKVGSKCIDTKTHEKLVVEIIEEDGKYYAKPEGLDAELIKEVYKGLKVIK